MRTRFPFQARRSGRFARSGLVVALLGTVVVATGHPVIAAEPAPTVTEAVDAGTAVEAARRSGVRVEVLSERSETAQVFANPTGSFTWEQYAEPQRVRRGSGWVPVDLTLVRHPGGGVGPTASTVDLSLSGGGDGSLVTLGDFGLTWPGTLPAPVLAGATATYPEVLPGVDLAVTATATGFREALVVKNRAAAGNPALRRIPFGVRTQGLRVVPGPDGSTTVVDGGTPVLASGTPYMWDTPVASMTPAAVERRLADGSLPEPRRTAMRLSVTPGTVTVLPDAAVLADPTLSFPLVIDPSWANYKTAWVHFNTNSPNQLVWGWDQEGGLAKVGKTYDDPCCVYRSVFRIPTNPVFFGTTVTDARFFITLDHSPNCTARNVTLHRTGAIGTGSKWSTFAGTWNATAMDTRAGAAYPGCTDPLAMEFAGTLKSYLQDAAANNWGEVNLGLKAQSETDQNFWKKFQPNTARISVTYNHTPNVPSSLSTVPPTPCGTSGAPTPLNTAQPMFTARHTDLDEQNLTGRLEILDGTTVIRTLDTPSAVRNSVVAWPAVPVGTLPESQPARVFNYRARTIDADGAVSGDTARCYFTVDREVPGTPTVDSVDFPNGEPVLAVGQVGTLTLSPGFGPLGLPDTDVSGYRYGFQQDKLTGWAAATTAGSAAIPMVLWQTARTLYVQAVDRAGNPSVSEEPCICTAWDMRATASSATPAHKPADVNGDGLGDISTLFDLGDGRGTAWTFQARPGGFHAPYIGWDAGINGGFPGYRTRSVTGDFTGDGLGDVAIFREDPDRRLRLFLAQGDSHRYDVIGNERWAGPANSAQWTLANIKIVAGNFDGTGPDDLVAIVHSGSNGWTVYFWSGSGGLTSNTSWYVQPDGTSPWTGFTTLAGDFTGDGRADLANVQNVTTGQTRIYVHPSTGTALGAASAFYDSGAGGFTYASAIYAAADVNGDTRTDIVALYNDGRLLTFPSTGSAMTWSTWWTAPAGSGFDPLKAQLATGDYNGDGRTDVATLYDTTAASSKVHAFYTNATGTGFVAPNLAAPAWSGPIGHRGPNLVTVEPGRQYWLVARHSNKCLNVSGGGSANNANIIQFGCIVGATNELFSFVPVGTGPYYQVKIANAGKCVNVETGKIDDLLEVIQFTCMSAPGVTAYGNEQWRLEYLGGTGLDTLVRLRVSHSDKCLNITGAGMADLALAIQFICSGTANEEFYLRMRS